MPSFASAARLSLLTLLFVAACDRSGTAGKDQSADKKPAAKTGAAAGEVGRAGAPGMTSGLNDSISTRADKGRIRGADSAALWIVEISDFQCPFCKQWHDETFATIDKEFVQTGKARIAYLNFPISSLHPNATLAAEAAMCASVQGKFWELHNSLFLEQQKWAGEKNAMPILEALAKSADVDLKNWNACMAAHAAMPLINADRERSGAAGVQSTPTFFVGTRKILGAYPADTFRVAINAELAKLKAAH